MIETKTILICAGLGLFLMMVPVIYRIIKGPTAIDRIVAVNVIGTKTAVSVSYTHLTLPTKA